MTLYIQLHAQEKLHVDVDTGLGGHRNRQSCSMSTLSAHPLSPQRDYLNVCTYLALSTILWCRCVPVGVVYAGNNVIFKK